jgi:hypothetical protein
MKSLGVVVAIGCAAVLGWYLIRHTRPVATAAVIDLPPAPRVGVDPSQAPGAITHATKLARAERRELADRIAAARAARGSAASTTASAAIHAPLPPSLAPAPTLDPDHPDDLKTTLRATIREAVPLLAACYEAAIPQLPEAETHIAAQLTLTSDPDVGTIIDAHQLSDDQGHPLLASFDDCLRDTMQQLALPPIAGANQGPVTIEVTYPFRFSK